MFSYKVIKELLRDPDGNNYITFGICVLDADSREIDLVSDISVDRNVVEKLVEHCNALELDPTHLRDVVDDTVNAVL